MKPSYQTGRVCVICDGLGDLICAGQAFKLFKEQYPTHQLFLCTWGGIFVESQQYNPYLDGVFAVDGQPHMQAAHMLQAGFKHEELVVLDNIVHFARFLDVGTIQKINEQIQFDPNKLNHFIQQYNNISGALDWWWRTLSVFKLDLANGYSMQLCGRMLPDDSVPEFYCGPEDTKYSNTLNDLTPYILINHSTGTNKDAKQWPLDRWHSLMTLLLDNYPKLSIVTVGNPSDMIVPFFGENAKRVRHLRDTRIREVYPIVEKATFYVCSQSGLAWLFGCSKTPGLQINIGSHKHISSLYKNPLVTIVDQANLFDPLSVSLEQTWMPLKERLDKID